MFGWFRKRRIRKGSIVRAIEAMTYHLSDFPGCRMFDKVEKGAETAILEVGSKINGERQFVVSWYNDGEHRHIVRRGQIELAK